VSDSPALDAGSGDTTADPDQRGVPRVTFANVGAYQATASALALTGLPATVVAGTPTTLTVSAVDSFGQSALGYRGTVSFTSTDPQADLPTPYVSRSPTIARTTSPSHWPRQAANQ
jgi:hypothetical protein